MRSSVVVMAAALGCVSCAGENTVVGDGSVADRVPLADGARLDASAFDATVDSSAGQDASGSMSDGSLGMDGAMDSGLPACQEGETRCGSSCVNTSFDTMNCGRCGVACPTVAGTIAVCNMGTCGVALADSGVRDGASADGAVADGARPDGAVSDGATDGGTCAMGTSLCGAECVDLQSHVENCGRCGVVCPPVEGRAVSCNRGMCFTGCPDGYDEDVITERCIMRAPRPVWPPVTSTTTSLRPTFKWALPMGVEGARVQVCANRACTMEVARFDAVGAQARPLANLPTNRTLFWRLFGRIGATTGTASSPTWQFRTGARNATGGRDTAAGVSMDGNGDGYDDVVVGAPGRTPMSYDVFNGSPMGIAATRTTQLTGLISTFGNSVASAGDVNGDGFADLVAAGNGGGSPILVFRGSASGLNTAPASAFFVDAPAVGTGSQIALAAGDVNADGYADVIVSFDDGSVALYHGGSTGLQRMAARVLCEAGTYCEAVAGAGDVNGDGFSDVVTGTRQYDSAMPSVGRVQVFRGSSAGLERTASRTIISSGDSNSYTYVWPGFDLRTLAMGDINGDGFTDLAVGDLNKPVRFGTGLVSIFMGSATGTEATEVRSIESVLPEQYAGEDVQFVDWNGDGFAELVMGQYLTSRFMGTCTAVNRGILDVYAAAPTGLAAASSRQFAHDSPSCDQHDPILTSFGDVNGDGLQDLVTGERYHGVVGGTRTGRVSVWHGTAAGITAMAANRELAGERDSRFGAVLSR